MLNIRYPLCRGVISFFLCLLLTACYLVEDVPLPSATLTPTTDYEPIRAYFTGGAGQNPAAALVEAVNSAQVSVYIAIYNFSLDDLTTALINAHRRGVDVRMVMESDNLQGEDEDALERAGIGIRGDDEPGLMHHKFVVIDGYEVWTGSMNFTAQSAQADANNLVRINSSRLAQTYTAVFNAMFEDGKFGAGEAVALPYPEVTVNGVRVQVFFSPFYSPGTALKELIRSAEEEITVLAFLWTSNPLAEALLTEAQQGVQVRGVFEADQVQSDANTDFPLFIDNGLAMRLDNNPVSLMHNKVIIVDRKVVAVGSYNFSASAETRNNENLVIIHSPQLAEAFYAEFTRLFEMAQTP